MFALFEALFTNPLLLSAMIAGFLSSIAGGIIGSYVVVKRIVFIAGGISHSVLGGIGICIWLNRVHNVEWASPLLGSCIAAIISALIIGWIHLYYRQREDSAIAALWSIGMAIGVLFISQTPGFNVELTNFLIGNILWISPSDLIILAFLNLVILFTVICLHKRFLNIYFDEDQAALQGQPVILLQMFLLILIATTVVILIQIVGIILVMTMLTIPPAIANIYTRSLSKMMIIAVILNSLFSFLGIAASFHLDWPTGASIALIAGASYVAALTIQLPIKNCYKMAKS